MKKVILYISAILFSLMIIFILPYILLKTNISSTDTSNSNNTYFSQTTKNQPNVDIVFSLK